MVHTCQKRCPNDRHSGGIKTFRVIHDFFYHLALESAFAGGDHTIKITTSDENLFDVTQAQMFIKKIIFKCCIHCQV